MGLIRMNKPPHWTDDGKLIINYDFHIEVTERFSNMVLEDVPDIYYGSTIDELNETFQQLYNMVVSDEV